jgi:hypothetical protein
VPNFVAAEISQLLASGSTNTHLVESSDFIFRHQNSAFALLLLSLSACVCLAWVATSFSAKGAANEYGATAGLVHAITAAAASSSPLSTTADSLLVTKW